MMMILLRPDQFDHRHHHQHPRRRACPRKQCCEKESDSNHLTIRLAAWPRPHTRKATTASIISCGSLAVGRPLSGSLTGSDRHASGRAGIHSTGHKYPTARSGGFSLGSSPHRTLASIESAARLIKFEGHRSEVLGRGRGVSEPDAGFDMYILVD